MSSNLHRAFPNVDPFIRESDMFKSSELWAVSGRVTFYVQLYVEQCSGRVQAGSSRCLIASLSLLLNKPSCGGYVKDADSKHAHQSSQFFHIVEKRLENYQKLPNIFYYEKTQHHPYVPITWISA